MTDGRQRMEKLRKQTEVLKNYVTKIGALRWTLNEVKSNKNVHHGKAETTFRNLLFYQSHFLYSPSISMN